MPFLVFFMTLGTLAVGYAVTKAVQLYGNGSRARRAYVRWLEDYQAASHDLVSAHGYLAAAEARVAELVEKMPKEFAAAARATLAHSESFKALHATTAEDAKRLVAPAPAIEPVPESGERERTLPSMTWIGGQLVATTPKAAA